MNTNIFDEYSQWTDLVTQYPATAQDQYLALGIVDELGELVDVYTHPVTQLRETILKECGDVCWYAARYARLTLNVPFSDVVARAKLHSMAPTFPMLMKATGIIAGVEKKRVRDGDNWTPQLIEKKNEQALNHLIVVMVFVIQVAQMQGVDLSTVLEINQGKLTGRLENGTIKGDGDTR